MWVYGIRSFFHKFSVNPIIPPSKCIFGADIFEKTGIMIQGVPIDFPDRQVVETHVDEIVEPLIENPELVSDALTEIDVTVKQASHFLDTENKDHAQYCDYLFTFQGRLRSFLNPLFIENSVLKGFCNLKDAVIDIDLSTAELVNRRQYPITQKATTSCHRKCSKPISQRSDPVSNQ
jgi:hypothetical protein